MNCPSPFILFMRLHEKAQWEIGRKFVQTVSQTASKRVYAQTGRPPLSRANAVNCLLHLRRIKVRIRSAHDSLVFLPFHELACLGRGQGYEWLISSPGWVCHFYLFILLLESRGEMGARVGRERPAPASIERLLSFKVYFCLLRQKHERFLCGRHFQLHDGIYRPYAHWLQNLYRVQGAWV